MFQSSSTASGSCRRQASSACSPSSASTIANSRPSRIRRATFRMTLESSTTRHVFITASHPSPRDRTRLRRHYVYDSGRERGRSHVQKTIDVDDDEQLPVKPMDSRRNAREPRIEIDRVGFASVVIEFEPLADLVDQQAVGFAL